jgi:glutaminase
MSINITEDELLKLGIHEQDPRFKSFFSGENTSVKNNFVSKYLKGQLSVHNWNEIKKIIEEIYQEVKADNQGNVADYIPELAEVNDELFGITVVTVDGQVFQIGDIDQKFCVQSCSKPITYGIALDNYGEDIVHNYVGKEPSGRNFNELCLNEDGLPHNPLINSGSIMSTSLINPGFSQAKRFNFALEYWNKLSANSGISFNNSVYLSEKDSADRNYCLGYMMQEKKAFQKGKKVEIAKKSNRKWDLGDLQSNLELYFQFCSLEVKLLGIGIVAASLANGGVNPWTNDKIFKHSTVKKILSLMLTCGMYDYSGEWGYKIGLPAKSGVSGLIYGIIPGVMGIAVYSPKLDSIGNSYRGVKFFQKLSDKLNIHIFDSEDDVDKISIKHKEANNKRLLGYLLLEAASENDCYTIREVISKGVSVNFADYDKRTALHLAVNESNKDAISLLLRRGANINSKDRWNKTPLGDAEGKEEILNLLNTNIEQLDSDSLSESEDSS